eukprot:TRINITY_DN22452_c0_g1_i1.p1 TRINITY_DN22452_c0_g1~~TRINITY_DN22452_c0_g1_i1.p1  ORF type:complete len:274 (+),score=72.85 TRINITY_DN22452_c0_g1_i1:211-1032(+)
MTLLVAAVIFLCVPLANSHIIFDPLANFTLRSGVFVVNGSLGSAFGVGQPQDCAVQCLANPNCVSFNFVPTSGQFAALCALQQYGPRYTVVADKSNNGTAYYLRNIVRNDAPVTPAIKYILATPTPSVLQTVFQRNLVNLLGYPLDDLLYYFRLRAGIPQPPGQCWGWDQNLQGSIAGLFMMGSANALRWTDNATLQAELDALIDGIAKLQASDGFIMAYHENETIVAENPNYVLSWVTHGLIDGQPDRPSPHARPAELVQLQPVPARVLAAG